MRILIIFALIISYCYANNINLKNPRHRCSYLLEAITDDPFMSGDFEIMKLIPLSQKSKTIAGKYFAMVDDEDYDYLMQWKWHLRNNKFTKNGTFYAGRCIGSTEKGNKHTVLMHREVMKLNDSEYEVDHKDHQGLNNQKYNLRKATRSENIRNMPKSQNRSSKYMGVSLNIAIDKYTRKDGTVWNSKPRSKWIATIGYNGKKYTLGRYINEEDAARAYDRKAKEVFGEFANLNFKE